MNWFDSWALSLAAFIPIVGTAVVLFVLRPTGQPGRDPADLPG